MLLRNLLLREYEELLVALLSSFTLNLLKRLPENPFSLLREKIVKKLIIFTVFDIVYCIQYLVFLKINNWNR